MKIIDYTFHEWIFRPNHYHIDCLQQAERFQSIKISSGDRDIDSTGCRAGIAGGDEELTAVFRLSDFPCKCMFATAGTKKKNVHGAKIKVGGGMVNGEGRVVSGE